VAIVEFKQEILLQRTGARVAWYGPIVMNTQQELGQAFEGLEKGTFLQK
jgi:redox-sensitive bicupin YhaK (pirin superfamily)